MEALFTPDDGGAKEDISSKAKVNPFSIKTTIMKSKIETKTPSSAPKETLKETLAIQSIDSSPENIPETVEDAKIMAQKL